MIRHPRAAVPALLAVVLAAGCSSSGNPDDPGSIKGAEGATTVVNTVIKGLDAGDGPRVCSLLDKHVQAAFARSLKVSDCPAAVDAWHAKHPSTSQSANALKAAVNGTTATVTGGPSIDILTDQGKWKLHTESSRWEIGLP